MIRKLVCLILCFLFSIAILSACAKSPQGSEKVIRTALQTRKPDVTATSTIQPTEKVIIPTPTEEEPTVTETEVIDSCTNTSNPCECLGEKYEYDKELGVIKEEYLGSWHAAAFVGSAYNARFVFLPSGNYLFFPSQYECEFGNESCKPSPIEEGLWGIQDSQLNLAKEGDIKNVRSISIGEVIDSPPDESPYPLKTAFDRITYWKLSKDTNIWNPETGELCDGN
jgi:hypothetical protein